MYVFMLIIGTLIYVRKRYSLKDDKARKEQKLMVIDNFLISAIINHIVIYLVLGDINMNYTLNNITPSFFIKYLILCVLGAEVVYQIEKNMKCTKISIKRNKQFKKILNLKNSLTILLVILCIFLYCLSRSFISSYSNIPAEQLAFHLQVPISEGSNSVVLDCIKMPIIIAIFSSVIIVISAMINCYTVNIFLTNKDKKIKILPIKIKNWMVNVLSIIIILATILNLCNKINLKEFIYNQFKESKFISENYVSPNNIIEFPESKQNLIYIYLESMESTHSDYENGGNYQINYIPNLTKLSQDNISLSTNNNRFYQITGTDWTIASMLHKQVAYH